MAIAQVTKASETISEGWDKYNATVTALLLEHTSAGAHNTTALASLGLNNHIKNLTSAEVDILDGATVSTAELNILDGASSELTSLTDAEIQQLQNIGSTTISLAQWGYLGACGAGGGQLLAGLTTGESTQLEAIGATTISLAQWGYLGACVAGGGQLLAALTTGESTQLEAIGATTISDVQWGYLGACGAGGGQLLAALTAAESTQLELIGDTTISAAQWGFVGDMNLGVSIGNPPAFLVHPTASQDNIAINTDVEIVWGTEIYDQGGNFAANTFTAPVTGKYSLHALVRLDAIDTDATMLELKLVTSNRTYYSYLDPSKFSGDLASCSMHLSVIADMDATDTALVQIYQTGGAAQMDINVRSWFSGVLVA